MPAWGFFSLEGVAIALMSFNVLLVVAKMVEKILIKICDVLGILIYFIFKRGYLITKLKG
jgi:hypothetical protein